MSDTWETTETCKLVLDDDGVKRWYFDGRDGLEAVGDEDSTLLSLKSDNYEAGTVITLTEVHHE